PSPPMHHSLCILSYVENCMRGGCRGIGPDDAGDGTGAQGGGARSPLRLRRDGEVRASERDRLPGAPPSGPRRPPGIGLGGRGRGEGGGASATPHVPAAGGRAGVLARGGGGSGVARAGGRPRRRTYRLTPAGRASLAEAEAKLAEVERILRDLPAAKAGET